MSEVHLRLASVTIENLRWQDFIRRYDRDEICFYLDPPYYKAPYYRHNLELAPDKRGQPNASPDKAGERKGKYEKNSQRVCAIISKCGVGARSES